MKSIVARSVANAAGRASGAGVAVGLVGAMALSALAHAQPVTTRVSLARGDTFPTSPALVVTATNQFSGLAINRSGGIVAAILGEQAGTPVSVLYSEQSAQRFLAAVSGAPAPGGGVVPGLGGRRFNLSDNGHIIFGSDADLLRASLGGLTRVYTPGQIAPGAAGFTLGNVVDPIENAVPAVNGQGVLAPRIALNGDGGASAEAIYYVTGGGNLLLWQRTVSSLDPTGTGNVVLGQASINSTGMCVTDALVRQNAVFFRVILVGTPSQTQIAAQQGQQVAGFADNVIFAQLGASPSINVAGRVAFAAQLVGPGITSENDGVIFSWHSGTLSVVAREGDAVGAGTLVGLNSADPLQAPVIADDGTVAFPADVRVGTVTRPAIVLRSPQGSLRTLARVGEPVPGLAGAIFTAVTPSATARTIHLTPSGRALIAVNTSFGSPTLLATRAAGDLVPVAVLGQAVDVRGTQRVLAQITLGATAPQSTGGSDGRPRLMNDAGQVVFEATFADSAAPLSAIFVASVPPGCDSVDFNRDGDFPTPLDLEDFVNANAGNICSTCSKDLDFNNDGDFPTPLDVEAFISVLGGGECA